MKVLQFRLCLNGVGTFGVGGPVAVDREKKRIKRQVQKVESALLRNRNDSGEQASSG